MRRAIGFGLLFLPVVVVVVSALIWGGTEGRVVMATIGVIILGGWLVHSA